MTTLKDRIAALQANSGVAPSSVSSRSPSPAPSAVSDSAGSSGKGIVGGTRLKDKIARFDRIGGTPVPRASFGLGAPLTPASGPKEFYGNTADRPQVQRSASLRVPRTFEPDSVLSPNATEKPFETFSQRSRSGSSYSTASTGTSGSTRPSYLSPHYTGDSSLYFSRSASVRSTSPNPPSETNSPKASPLDSPRRALTADALANLPSSPSLRSNDITSSTATDADIESERTNLTTVGSTVPGSIASSAAMSATNTSFTNLTSPSSAAPTSAKSDAFGRGRTGTITGEPGSGSAPSTAPTSVVSHPSNDSVSSGSGSDVNETSATEGRPAAPSYMAQAAALFPLSKRQSVHLPPIPIFPDPASASAESSARSGPADIAVESASSRAISNTSTSSYPAAAHPATPSSFRPKSSGGRKSAISCSSAFDDGVSSRTSTDTAFFTAENESLSSTTTADTLRRGMADMALRLDTTGGQNGSGSGDQSNGSSNKSSIPPTPIPAAMLDVFPSPPPMARPNPPPPSIIVPAPIPGARSVRPNSTAAPQVQNTTGARPATSGVKPRKKKPMLIPGKWINSDDEDEEEDDTGNKGWARIIVSSRAR